MPRRYSLGGPGQLIVGDPDPLEVALKQAQLEELLQKPGLARAQLALQQREAEQAGETRLQQNRIASAGLELEKQKAIEAGDLAKAGLINEQQRTADIREYQRGQLGESRAGRESTATTARENIRAGLVGDVFTHLLPREGTEGGPARGAALKAATALGYPEIEKGFGVAGEAADVEAARAVLPEFQKYTPEQRTARLGELPAGQRKALLGLVNQPAPGTYGPPTEEATATAPVTTKGGIRMLDPNAPIFPGGGSALSTALPAVKRFVAPPGSGFERLFGGATPAPAPTPAPTTVTPPPAEPEATPGLPPDVLTLLRRRRARRQVAPV